MKKKGQKNKLKKNKKWLLSLVILLVLIGGYFFIGKDKLKASTVVTNGDFRLTAENKWNQEDRKNFAALEWDKVNGLNQSGYQLYQSEDGITWNNRSMKYGKSIRVLNIYPEEPKSNTLKEWMDGLALQAKDGSNLIQVTAVKISEYNANPNVYLKNSQGEYQYDVLMFGSWDHNNRKDLSENGKNETQAYIDSGRGVLFGHDVTNHPMFATFNKLLGTTSVNPPDAPSDVRLGGPEIRVKNDGFLMKYPFEMANEQTLIIPPAHNNLLSNKAIGTTWIMFKEPYTLFNKNFWENETWTMGWYLKTNGNVGMIQTGHSNGASTVDERKIIANTLYNLAQVSLDNFANDQTVKDDVAPELPKLWIRCGKDDEFSIGIDALDNGKEYQWYVEGDTKSNGTKKSDTVKENIVSNIAGYFYEVTDLATSNLEKKVEGYKDSYGRIDPIKYDLYVAPQNDSVSYETRSDFKFLGGKDSSKYIHVLAVDRSNNISQVNSKQVKSLPQYVDFKVERTGDEAKLINLNMDSSLNNRMGSLEILTSKNTVIKNFNTLILPKKWTANENSGTNGSNSYTFMIKDKNDLKTIADFINTLSFSINDPSNQKGEIKINFYENDKDVSAINQATKICWVENIPQKISLKAYDENNNPLPSGDLLLDQKLTINKKEIITQKNIDLYDFIKLVSSKGDHFLPLEWTITNEFQEGRLIYGSRKLTVHSRQVIHNQNDQVVLPKNGFGVFESETRQGRKKKEFSLTMNSTGNNESNFDTTIIRFESNEPLYTFISKVPMNYELVGYVLTTSNGQHQMSASTQTPIQVDVSVNPEIWLTTYIKPVTQNPSVYHWEYKENKLGTINVK
ncbi:hypothetical protein [Enterococcus ureasiticus]|uniref:DUF5057 domain-containing protein n=1 Tax=Enterococcus ureasiticus TaxID=903984 RepID=A0A1E5GG48_9ENTE|nr:hypothetical protein [Enterococcus ureasiticus]OEG11601.1 hypothetical protein BCR21_09935 [Enterococcus ureasiticus]